MIGQLRGRLVAKQPNQVVVDVGGVGYLVQIPLSTFAGLGELNSETTLLVHTHVREDQIALYGFLTAREKQLFRLLLEASGVGPALAVKLLSGMPLDELVLALRRGDVARLVQVPGVGRKTAERIVVELRDRLAALGVAEEEEKVAAHAPLEADVLSALLNLGYDRRAAERATAEAARNGVGRGFEELLRAALQHLSRPGKTAASARGGG
ncbi:MAG: Holliday junction branch migration protein RuvA [Firmicutes bacterium]|nr:Holliday junction branch migration protein RuvA [Bacillota bacterium]